MDMENNIKNLPPSTQEGGEAPDELEKKLMQLLALQKNIKRSLTALRWGALLAAVSAVIAFNEEMGQIGWQWLCSIADFLEATPQHICGFMIFLSAAMLLWKGIKLTYRAALEELLEEDNDDSI